MASISPIFRANFIQIDETLHNSHLQWLVWDGLVLIVTVIIFGLNLPLSYQVVLTILLIIGVSLNQLIPYHLTAVSTLPLPKNSSLDSLGEVEWQLGIAQLEIGHILQPNQQSSQVWQAVLLNANYYQVAVVLVFEVLNPLEKNVTLIVWQDQVTPNTWRQLCVLAKL